VRGYGDEMLRFAERPNGRVCDTPNGEDVALRLFAHPDEAADIAEAVQRLLAQGYLVLREDGLYIAEFKTLLGELRPDTSFYEDAYARDGYCCRYCGQEDPPLSIDHIVPRCQGGGDELENLAVACRSCNSRKNGRTPEQAGMVLC